MPYCDCHGERLYYDEQGTGNPLLFLHGWGNTADFWAPALEALPSHRIVRVDLPGFGRSTYSVAGRKQAYFAHATEVMREFCRMRDLSAFHVIANSIGGVIAVHLAFQNSQNLMIKGLILDSCPLLGTTGMSLKPRLFGLTPSLSYPLLALIKIPAIAEKLARNTFYDRTRVRPDDYRRLVQGFGQGAATAKYRSIRALTSLNLLPRLAEVRCPLFYLYGDKNLTLDVGIIRRNIEEKKIPVQFIAISNTAHYPQLEAPQIYYQNIRNIV